ncbi:pyridoxamine 5'-phosphate oxidase [Spiribacter pallidus]|uniref:Pyridoxine/pyridoxamine 5'-phosphate oxidase n=1 Tax=Spiribacter pallidus TaxID=1987936 RepID=A0ABV3TBJ3_9GAMM
MSDYYQAAIERFGDWLETARADERIIDPTAMTLATVSADGQPSARMVLLKQVDTSGFVFYTNTRSRKGAQLADNPKAALVFYWEALMRQVKVEGDVQVVSDAEADAYFASRPRLSQIGAWASHQSEPLESRAVFDTRVDSLEAEYAGREVPRPPHWTGFRVRPHWMEFWQGRDGRLHDRERYFRDAAGTWQWVLVNP